MVELVGLAAVSTVLPGFEAVMPNDARISNKPPHGAIAPR